MPGPLLAIIAGALAGGAASTIARLRRDGGNGFTMSKLALGIDPTNYHNHVIVPKALAPWVQTVDRRCWSTYLAGHSVLALPGVAGRPSRLRFIRPSAWDTEYDVGELSGDIGTVNLPLLGQLTSHGLASTTVYNPTEVVTAVRGTTAVDGWDCDPPVCCFCPVAFRDVDHAHLWAAHFTAYVFCRGVMSNVSRALSRTGLGLTMRTVLQGMETGPLEFRVPSMNAWQTSKSLRAPSTWQEAFTLYLWGMSLLASLDAMPRGPALKSVRAAVDIGGPHHYEDRWAALVQAGAVDTKGFALSPGAAKVLGVGLGGAAKTYLTGSATAGIGTIVNCGIAIADQLNDKPPDEGIMGPLKWWDDSWTPTVLPMGAFTAPPLQPDNYLLVGMPRPVGFGDVRLGVMSLCPDEVSDYNLNPDHAPWDG